MTPNIPDPTLPRYPTINPRPFDIVIEPREFVPIAETGRLILAPGSAADTVKVTVGDVNSIIPTLDGLTLDSDPAPEISIPAPRWIYVKCVGVFGSPDTYTITIHTESASTPPTEVISPTGFTSYRIIGYVELVSGAAVIITNRTPGDLGVESFGSTNIWWTI